MLLLCLKWYIMEVLKGELMNKIIAKVLVGSRLHGLETKSSDYDWRGIHMNSLKDTLSPFKKTKNTSWIEGDEDNTSYELADFCKMATKGNATVLEVFFSDQIEVTSPIHKEMVENWPKFMNTNQFVMASRGYAHNQYNKMHLFDDIGNKGQSRTPKFAVAYTRVLYQCWKFLETGVFEPKILDEMWVTRMMSIKTDWHDEKIPIYTQWFMELQANVSKAWAETEHKLEPDTEWIEDFILRAYTGEIK